MGIHTPSKALGGTIVDDSTTWQSLDTLIYLIVRGAHSVTGWHEHPLHTIPMLVAVQESTCWLTALQPG